MHKCYLCGKYKLNIVLFVMNQASSFCILSLTRFYGQYWLIVFVVVLDWDMHIGAKKKFLICLYTIIACLAGGYVLLVKYSPPYKGIFTESLGNF